MDYSRAVDGETGETDGSVFAAEADRQTEVRDVILDAAERLLVHYGYQKMTMQDLAREAGIGVGTTYLHFQGKADVALGVINRANGRVLEQLRAISAQPLPADERVRQMIIARVLLRYEGARQVKHGLEEIAAIIGPLLREAKLPWMSAETQLFEAVLSEGRRRGELTWEAEMDVSAVAATLLTATCGLMPGRLSPADFSDPDAFRARTEWLAGMLARALSPCPPGSL